MQSMKRDVTFDVVRAICIVEVVCFWHLTNYIDNSFISESAFYVFGWMTTIVMGTFAFMSSYFLKRKKMETRKDVWDFYVARFKRFWVLYFIASILLYLASSLAGQPWYTSFGNFVLSLLGLTMFFQPMPPTLWYMVMLMFFYMLTPPILFIKDVKLKMLLAVVLYVVLLLMQKFHWCDTRVIWYYPMYVLGLLLPDMVVKKIKENVLFSFMGGAVAVACTFLALYHSSYFSSYICIAGFPIVLAVSELLAKVKVVCRMATLVSYALLCMYLFHRHFYLVLVIIWNLRVSVGVKDATIPIWFAYMVVCPLMFFGTYIIQRYYDRVVNQYWK